MLPHSNVPINPVVVLRVRTDMPAFTMKNLAAIISTVYAFGVAEIAHADWQYTKWGMTPEQVITASKGAASMRDFDQGLGSQFPVTKELQADYASGRHTFTVKFNFENGGLKGVSLYRKSPETCYELRQDLEAVYGKPWQKSDDRFSSMWTWLDREKNNTIVLIEIKSCLLNYSSLHMEAAKGL